MLVIVTGMRREARIFGRDANVVVCGGDNSTLAAKLEATLARGGRAVISAGICGGLSPALAVGTPVIGSGTVRQKTRWSADAAWQDALAAKVPHAVRGTIAGSDVILTDPAHKAFLYGETGAIAVDMESHICARIAAARGVPFAVLRVVSDAAANELPPAVSRALDAKGNVRMGAVLWSVAAQPRQVPELLQTARNTRRALAELLRCFDLLGRDFACPYLG
jgi:hopanoid-associated phosphorylase